MEISKETMIDRKFIKYLIIRSFDNNIFFKYINDNNNFSISY
jgi:hypothetical protein